MPNLSDLVATSTSIPSLEVYKNLALVDYIDKRQNFTINSLTRVTWDTLVLHDSTKFSATLSNSWLTIPSGKYAYRYDVALFDIGDRMNRGALVGLSAQGDTSSTCLVNPYGATNDMVYTGVWNQEGIFSIDTTKSISYIVALPYRGGAYTCSVAFAGYYGSDDNTIWNLANNPICSSLSASVGKLTLWKLR
jgi:hypothetical protein